MRIHPFTPPAIVMAATALLFLGGGVRLQASEEDGRIVAAARSSYNFKTYLKDDAIKVECAGGQVQLTGTVAEEFHRALAEQTVSGLPGVTGVDNRITVNGPPLCKPPAAVRTNKREASLRPSMVKRTSSPEPSRGVTQ